MENEFVNKIERNLIEAQNLVEEAAAMLCNEPGDTPGGGMWRVLRDLAEKIEEPLHYTYRLRGLNY